MPRLTWLVAVLGVVACSDPIPIPTGPDIRGPAADTTTAAAQWNRHTREVIGRRGGSSNVAARVFALVSVAQYNAVIAATRAPARGARPSEAGAAAAASATVLAGLYPDEQGFVDEQLATDAAYFTALPSQRHSDFAAGVALGRTAGAAVLAYAATDGSVASWAGTIPTGPGFWLNDSPSGKPSEPQWGQIRPWLMESADQFRPPPPPPFGSPDFQEALAEVREISDTRTEEQLRIAQFWATGYGAGGPAGWFGTVATDLTGHRRLDERRAALVLAVMHMAIMDASIACYEAKYHYWYIPAFQADPAIVLPVRRPNFPSYPSGHSCLSSAAGGVLAGLFPSESSDLEAMVEEAGISRLYAGLHYRFEIAAGQDLGYGIARLALRRGPNGRRPIALD
jgi:membrane-associated phospholipid phosphatase